MVAGKLKLTGLSRHRVLMASALAIAIAATTLVNLALFNGATAQRAPDGPTVRISALKSESGSVRVALQQQQAGGGWSERQHPELNTLGAMARTGAWLNSSPLQLAATSAQGGPLYCVVAHGAPDDYFWQLLRGYSLKAEADLNANVRFVTSLDGATQASAIDQCARDGATVIASTLADPEAVSPSLIAAKAAGVRIITFNSDVSHAHAVGSEIHIALDERATGRLAAQTFADAGVGGDIGCVVHEATNVGLDERCAGLVEAYSGKVHRMEVHGLSRDLAVAAIAARLTDPEQPALHGLLTMNADTMLVAFDAILETSDQIEQRIRLCSVGAGPEVRNYSRVDREAHLLCVFNNMSEAQGYLITAALRMIDDFHVPQAFVQTTLVIKGSPFIFHSANLRDFPEQAAELRRRFRELQAAADADEAGQ